MAIFRRRHYYHRCSMHFHMQIALGFNQSSKYIIRKILNTRVIATIIPLISSAASFAIIYFLNANLWTSEHNVNNYFNITVLTRYCNFQYNFLYYNNFPQIYIEYYGE